MGRKIPEDSDRPGNMIFRTVFRGMIGELDADL